jgi:hypothetical protein
MKRCEIIISNINNTIKNTTCDQFYSEINPMLHKTHEHECKFDQKALMQKIYDCSKK